MDHRYRGSLKFEGGFIYSPFHIEQCKPKPGRLGVGPYCVIYKDNVVHQDQYKGDCKYWVEDLDNDYRQLTKNIQELKSDFSDKWKLPDFPEEL